MGKFTRLSLLLVLVITCLSSLKGRAAGPSAFHVAPYSFSYFISHSSPFLCFEHRKNTILHGKLHTHASSPEEETSRVDRHRTKKKIKRWSQPFPELKPPVKHVELIPFNVFSKIHYSKPHFLSQLHAFLFRFTPF